MKNVEIKITGFESNLTYHEIIKTIDISFNLETLLDFIKEFKDKFEYDEVYGYELKYEDMMFELNNSGLFHYLYVNLNLKSIEFLKTFEITFTQNLIP